MADRAAALAAQDNPDVPERDTPTPLGWVKVEPDPSEPPMRFDRFGFQIADNPPDARPGREERNHNYYDDNLATSSTAQNTWNKLLSNWDDLTPQKREEHIKSGVPSNLRGRVWCAVLGINAVKRAARFVYDEELKIAIEIRDSRVIAEEQEDEYRRQWAANYGTPAAKSMRKPKELLGEDGRYPTPKALKQIDLDLDRTFYDHKNLIQKGGDGQLSLFNVLAVYARVNPKVGYCQGMAYIAAVLLMNMEEEEAFWAFYMLMGSKVHFDGFFSENLGRVQHEAAVFDEVVQLAMPDLSAHMKDMGIHPLMYVTPWLMCAFTALPLWDTVMCIWDMMMLQGTKTLTRAALAVMTVCKQDLLASDSLGTLLPYLQHLPAAKTSRPGFPKAMWKIKTSTLDSLVTRAEAAIAAAAKATPKPVQRRGSKRPRSEDEVSTPATNRGSHSDPATSPSNSKRARQSETQDAAPTPSVFRRFFNSLATPLRTRVRADGGVTPAPRRKGSNTSLFGGTTKSTAAVAASIRTPLLEVNSDAKDDSPMVSAAPLSAAKSRFAAAFGHSSPFASPFGPDSPFNRSGFLSPSFNGKIPTVLSPLISAVSTMSPSVFANAKESFASFSKQTPRRTSLGRNDASSTKSLEMKTFKASTSAAGKRGPLLKAGNRQ